MKLIRRWLSSKAPHSLRFLTYNVFYGREGTLFSSVRSLAEHFLFSHVRNFLGSATDRTRDAFALLKELDADVLCLNEVPSGDSFEALQEFLITHNYRIASAFPHTSADVLHRGILGTVLAYRHEAERLPFNLPDFPGTLDDIRGAVALHIPHTNITVLGAHLSLFNSERKEEIRVISNLLASERALGREVVVLGDFNESHTALILRPEFRQLRLKSRLRYTFPSFWPMRSIDRIYWSRGLTCNRFKTVRGLSDHLLAFADIVCRKKPL